MRISDWISDVCSSDLITIPAGTQQLGGYDDSLVHSASVSVGMQPGGRPFGWSVGAGYDREDASQLDQRYEAKYARADITVPVSANVALLGGVGYENIEIGQPSALLRSEEQTSELQSLMRISYAVFCLQKKNKDTN